MDMAFFRLLLKKRLLSQAEFLEKQLAAWDKEAGRHVVVLWAGKEVEGKIKPRIPVARDAGLSSNGSGASVPQQRSDNSSKPDQEGYNCAYKPQL